MKSPPQVAIAIPARFGSKRLPGKALLEIGGEPMVVRVWRRCLEVGGVSEVLVATDDERIREVLEKAGAKVAMTSARHRSGTDRIAEALREHPCDVVVNVQGDEPFLEAEAVERLIGYYAGGGTAPVATLASPVEKAEDLWNPSVVKVVTGVSGDALYFSRLPVPYRESLERPGETPEGSPGRWLRHHGVYAYQAGFLQKITAVDPTPLEKAERLEQLRVLEMGERIHVIVTTCGGCGVDTLQDLEEARRRAEESE